MTTELYCCDTACSVGDAIEVLASFSTPRAEPGIVGRAWQSWQNLAEVVEPVIIGRTWQRRQDLAEPGITGRAW